MKKFVGALLVAILVCVPVTAKGSIKLYDEMLHIPQNIVDACEKYGEEYNIQPEFIEAVCWYESNYNPNISNKAGTCHGLMQISYSAHSDRMKRLGVTDIFDVDGNIHVGADFLCELFEGYEDPAIVLAVYNGQSEAKIARIQYGEISTYAEHILEFSRVLEVYHGK